jgi:hypothetical protein
VVAAAPVAVEQDDYDLDDGGIVDMAIRVVVRKRPMSRGELSKGDRDVMDIARGGSVMVHEPKTKVDLTKVIETQKFTFDDAFDADETNEVIYSRTIKHLVSFVFDGGKASCFAYGQTGSGKVPPLFLFFIAFITLCDLIILYTDLLNDGQSSRRACRGHRERRTLRLGCSRHLFIRETTQVSTHKNLSELLRDLRREVVRFAE